MSKPSKVRVARDERGERVRFEDIRIGQELGQMEWIVTEEGIRAECETDGTFHEWYHVDSPFGGTIAPTQVGYLPPRILFGSFYNVRGLFYKWDLENFNPIRPNTKMFVTAKVTNKWVNQKQREFVEYEAECRDEGGTLIYRTRRSHALDFLPRTAPKTGVGVEGASMKDRLAGKTFGKTKGKGR